MPVNAVCMRNTPPLPGGPQDVPLTFPPLYIPIERASPAMPIAQPTYISDFPLSRISTQYWLATLARATYSVGSALFNQVARAVVPTATPITFVPNGGGLTPGYGIIKLPQCLVVVISGTTNLAQWLSQLFLNDLIPTSYPLNGGNDNGLTMSLYKSAADAIDTAIATAAGNDRPVLLCGHSMGGAVATILHYKYREETTARKQSRLMTFGAPKPGNQAIANGVRTSAQTFRRFTTPGDPVPSLPPTVLPLTIPVLPAPLNTLANTWGQYFQPGSLYAIADDGTQVVISEPSFPLFAAGAVVAVGAGQALSIPTPHLMRAYVSRLRAGFGSNLPAAETTRWANPSHLETANAVLNAAGL